MRILTVILFSLLLSGCIHVFDESKPLIRGEGINDEHIVEAQTLIVNEDGTGELK